MGQENIKGFIHSLLKRQWRQPRISSVQRRINLDPDIFLSEYANKGYPVILVSSTFAPANNCFAVVRTTLGKKRIEVRYGDYAQPEEYAYRRHVRNMFMEDYLDDLFSRKSHDVGYAANNKISIAELKRLGVTCPIYYPKRMFKEPSLWIGHAGNITPLHADGLDNFAHHLEGRKRWLIFPTRDYPYLHMSQPKPESAPNFYTSSLDLRHSARDIVPKGALGIEVYINRGETLYLPAGWAHFVETLQPSIMVNFWLDGTKCKPAVLVSS